MRQRRTKSFVSVLLAAIAIAAVGVRPTEACVGSQAISTCSSTTTCTANCFLQTDLNCADGQGITLNAGYDLDLCGHTITCTSPICYAAKPAVKMAGKQL